MRQREKLGAVQQQQYRVEGGSGGGGGAGGRMRISSMQSAKSMPAMLYETRV